jgi:hypothetical protein
VLGIMISRRVGGSKQKQKQRRVLDISFKRWKGINIILFLRVHDVS